ncbi:hypothetical protein O3P69_020816 [Scylla paramamosain]|uniref:Uncharacterized protein n=1 Tax=Scylla paramamosain TaxID=85552 RepID=A0AAW0TNJ9_SCYPA
MFKVSGAGMHETGLLLRRRPGGHTSTSRVAHDELCAVRGAAHPRTDRLRVRAVVSGRDERQVYRGADPSLPALITLQPLRPPGPRCDVADRRDCSR